LAWLDKNQKIFHEQVPALARASVKTLNYMKWNEEMKQALKLMKWNKGTIRLKTIRLRTGSSILLLSCAIDISSC
jgi:hypothetical protein